jgi:hypothetical protein
MKLEDFLAQKKKPLPTPEYLVMTPEQAAQWEKENEAQNAKVEAGRQKQLAAGVPIQTGKPIDVAGELKPKEVANPTRPEVKKAVVESPKIDSPTVASIKQSLGVQDQPEAPAPRARVEDQQVLDPTAVDLASIREQVAEQGPQTGWSDVLVGAIPLIADMMAGGYGDAVGLGGKYLLDKESENIKRRNTLEDKLIAMKTAKGKSKNLSFEERAELERIKASLKGGVDAKASNLVQIDTPEGPVYEWAGLAAGKRAAQNTSGMTFEQRTELEKLKARLKGLNDKEKLTKAEEKEKKNLEMTLSQRWEQNKFTQGSRDVASAYKRIASIDANNASPVDDMGAIFDLMKILDPASVVRESEQAMAIGARSYEDVVNYFDSILSGNRKLTPTQVNNIKKFAKRLYDQRGQAQKDVDAGFLTKARKYGLDPENVVQPIFESHAVKWKGKTIFFNSKEEADEAAKVPGAERVR